MTRNIFLNTSLKEIVDHTRENILDLLAIGFDPDRTRIIVDTADGDVVYPLATAFAKAVTQSTVEATYGKPALQTTHQCR